MKENIIKLLARAFITSGEDDFEYWCECNEIDDDDLILEITYKIKDHIGRVKDSLI